ncbi:hypothetical protein AgCh_001422 [Apium graveolens]
MKDRMPHSAFMRDGKGNHWHVEVSKRENKAFLEAGWSKFVQEKIVQWGDFLLFEHDGESFFDVKIFGDTTCEKEFNAEVFEARVKEEEEMEEEESEEEEEEEMEEEESEDSENDEDDDQDEILVLRDENRRHKSKKGDSSCSGGRGRGRGDNMKTTTELSDEMIFDHVDRPKNPYFVGKLDPKRKSDLRVPTDVIRDFKLKPSKTYRHL